MKLIQGKEAITATMLIVLISCPVWLIAGAVLTSKLHHLFGVRNTSWFLIFLGMGVPLGLIIAWSKSRITKTNAQRMAMSHAARLGDTDYYHCTQVNSISISTTSRTISVFRSKKMFDKSNAIDERIDIPVEKLKTYRAHAPGHTVQNTHGPAVTQGIDSAIDAFRNAQASRAAGKTTGLYLELDDVMRPEVFVRMGFDDAKKWFLLFDKLDDGSLEKQPRAMFYPRESALAPN